MALAYGYVKAKVVSAPTLKATRHHKETRGFVHRPGNDSNDHNDIWQDGALLVDPGENECVAYFSAFDQQHVPTDDLGNPQPGAHTI